MRNTLLLIAFFVMCCQQGNAQQKYGHIDSKEILNAMPEYKQLMNALEKKRKDQETRLGGMYKSFETRQKELQEIAPALMEAVREEKMIELDSLQKAIVAYEEQMDFDLQKLQAKLLKPLNDKYLKIVEAVSKENGYTYIFDIATGSVVYYPPASGDITGLVKKKMGIGQ
ncbi:MAG TPA: OmpH family outer membrane protein [Bacteroidia bacterium]|nr:OmpH family outer membrane protein [Bacteroidia bacterium]